MRLYTCYSPSHEKMYQDYFLPSLVDGEYDLVVKKLDQTCPTGEFETEGWNVCTRNKILLYKQAVKENWGRSFVWADVDLQFFGPTKEILRQELGYYDLAAQSEYPHGKDFELCAGLFIAKGNAHTMKLFQTMLDCYEGERDDQSSMNRHRDIVKWKLLPDRFWCKNLSVTPPDNMLVHHANWIRGVQNKLDALEDMKKRFGFRRNGV